MGHVSPNAPCSESMAIPELFACEGEALQLWNGTHVMKLGLNMDDRINSCGLH